MRKLICILLTTLLIVFLSFQTKANYEVSNSVKFYDRNLEVAIRKVINRPTGALIKNDVLSITELDLSNKGISDLRGLEELIYLEELDLSQNNLDVNTTPVIGNLIYLEDLNLRETGIENIAFLRNLYLLKRLNLHSNPIKSIKPIKDLTQLEELILRNVDIGDQIYYLSPLTKLKELNVRNSNIRNFNVIVNLMKQGALQHGGSRIDLLDNPGLNQSKKALMPYWDNITDRSPEKLDTLLPPIVSHDSGFYTDGFNLEFKSNNQDTQIYYTLDGSEPSINNLNGYTFYIKQTYPYGALEKRQYKTITYNSPIRIYNKTTSPNYLSTINTTYNNYFNKPNSNLYKANIIKAKECTTSGVCSETITNTYFVHPDINNLYDLPIVSITANEDDLFGYDKGIYVAGKVFSDWRINNPHGNLDGLTPANYNQRSDYWEKHANLSFFEPDGSLGFSQDVGLRIQGAWSRTFQRKSIRIYARSEYDDDSSIYYDLFQGLTKKSDSTQSVKDFKRLILRNGGNLSDSQFYADAVMQGLVSHLSIDTQAYRPAVHFINGEYWGIINIRERYDEHYLKSHYAIEEEDAVIIANYSEVEVGKPSDVDDMNHLRDYVLTKDMRNVNHYNYVQSKLDIQNFIEYNIANIYNANTDWPGNNVRFWRKRTTDTTNTAYGHDGKWRFMLFDTDFGFGNINSVYYHDTLEFATQAHHNNWPNPAWSTALFRRLLENPDFKNQFINTFLDQLNTTYKPERVEAYINKITEQISHDFPEHYKRWNSQYLNNSQMITFGNKRPTYIYHSLENHFQLGDLVNVTLNTNETSNVEMGYLKLNSLTLTSETPGIDNDLKFTGKYYKNMEISVTAIPKPGYKFFKWEGTNNTTSSIRINLTQDISLRALFIEDMDYVIDFPDPNLKKELSKLLNKDEITIRDLIFMKELQLNNKNIHNIEGLQYAINLRHLDLGNNNITDLKPIHKLENLQYLNLDSNIYIDSISEIKGLTTLEDLNLNHLSIGNQIHYIAHLQRLNRLSLRNTGITDISVLIPIIENGSLSIRNQIDLSENKIRNIDLLESYYQNKDLPLLIFTIPIVTFTVTGLSILYFYKRKTKKSNI